MQACNVHACSVLTGHTHNICSAYASACTHLKKPPEKPPPAATLTKIDAPMAIGATGPKPGLETAVAQTVEFCAEHVQCACSVRIWVCGASVHMRCILHADKRSGGARSGEVVSGRGVRRGGGRAARCTKTKVPRNSHTKIAT